MPILTQPAFGPRTALAYVTGGTLLDVWTLVWYFTRDHDLTKTGWFWVSGLVLTGLTFIILGFFLGPLGRAARQSELPPVGAATHAETEIQKAAAANPAPAAAAPSSAPVAAAPVAAPPAGTVLPSQPVTIRMT